MPQKILSMIGALKTSPSAGVKRSRVAIFCPEGFEPERPFLVVLFFHGYESLCADGHRRPFEESLHRHALARQLAKSGLNAILVAPRVALSAREHRPGTPFTTPGCFDAVMREAAAMVAVLLNASRGFVRAFMRAPLLLTGFSGGHHALSSLVGHRSVIGRTRAVAFFDALYDDDRYACDPDGLLERTALICINRRGYDRDNGPKEANYRKRLADCGVVPKRLDTVRSIRPGMALIERLERAQHCSMVASGDCLARVMRKVGGEGFRLLKPRAAAG